MEEMTYKSFTANLEEKSEREDGSLHIKFYGAAFDNVDSWGDIIVPTAFDEFLKSEAAGRVKLCFQHDMQNVIGVITSMTPDNYGLLCEADILPTTQGKDVITLLKAGAINEFSIGYLADRYHFEKREGMDNEVRILEAISLWEISPVTRAANPKAILLDAKSEDFTNGLKALTEDELVAMKEAIDNERINRLASAL